VGKEELEVKRVRESPQHFSTTGSRKVTKNARAGEKNLPQVLFSSQKPGEMMRRCCYSCDAASVKKIKLANR
jgi:hypothetical protein